MSAEDRKTGSSFFAHKFTIPTSVKIDPVRWNKEWDKALHPFSAKDVYATLSPIWSSDVLDPAQREELAEPLKGRLLSCQNLAAKLWAEMEEGQHFTTAWLLLEERDRQTHLLRGLEEACKESLLGVDTRAMCPDIKISLMLKRQGKAYIDFISSFTKEKKALGENGIYHIPSQWWETAVDLCNSPSQEVNSPSPEISSPVQEVNTPFAFLTLQRNEFIAQFLLHATMSVLKDLGQGSTSMDPVISILKSDFGGGVGKMLREMRDKPLIRCEECTKSPEDIGENIKFMICSICKAKLDFAVYYCSRECQKEDWHEHKKVCGKQKPTKQLPGTIRDPLWKHPSVPDYVRNVRVEPTGDVHITSTGFGTPHPSRPHSPALQRQVSLLTGDKYADYFLFDELDRPVRFMIWDMCTKMAFRGLRAEALSSPEPKGLPAVAEYLIKMMEHKPGLSRERILAQLSREYSEDMVGIVAKWEQSTAAKGYAPGTTFMEVMGKNMASAVPKMMNLGK